MARGLVEDRMGVKEDRLAVKEERLGELRRDAGRTGRVAAPGIVPAGGPLPEQRTAPGASVTTGYYGLPLLKQPTWIWTIPVYFFVGGAAGAAAIIAAAAQWRRGETALVRDARRIAMIGGALSPVLLIADLGRPGRFLNMLRVFKRQSPMSVGVWLLVGLNAAVDGGRLLKWAIGARHRRLSEGATLSGSRVVGGAADAVGAVLGGGVATYTGVLIGVTAVPVWARNIRLLPFHFGMSAFASAACMLELRHDDPALNRIGWVAAAGETIAGTLIEVDRSRVQDPLKHGLSGRLTRAGGVLSGPAALGIRALAGRSRRARWFAALVALAGSLMTRFAWIEAGKRSAADPREPLGLPPADVSRSEALSVAGESFGTSVTVAC